MYVDKKGKIVYGATEWQKYCFTDSFAIYCWKKNRLYYILLVLK